ncbi:MAG: PIG-L deacetylase family protein [Nitrospinota bacterium]|nr:PIG-L deacetylase family protein [Nitrospinota bacterium]
MNNKEFKNVLIIMAHPDDAELGVGGSIAKWVREGTVVRTIICTNGDKGTKEDFSTHEIAEIREKEQIKASDILGVKETLFLRNRDGELEDTKAFRNQIAFLIRHFQPDTIVTHDPWRPHYQHPDHQAVGHATFKGMIYARDYHFLPELTFAGIKAHHTTNILYTGSTDPSFFVDITETIEIKIESIKCHVSQVGEQYNAKERHYKRAKENGSKGGYKLAEAFTIKTMS